MLCKSQTSFLEHITPVLALIFMFDFQINSVKESNDVQK